MKDAPLHSYPWYVADWVRSETRIKLSSAGRGMFRELLDYCWIEGTLPNDPRALRSISGGTEKEFTAEWPIIEKNFTVDGDRLRHWKVDAKRPELVSYQRQRSTAGKASVEARRQRKLNDRSTSVQTTDETSVQTNTPVSFKPSLSLSVSLPVHGNTTPQRARGANGATPADGPDPQQLVSAAVEAVAQFWPKPGDKHYAAAAWEREAAASAHGVAGWCERIVVTARAHATAHTVAAQTTKGHFIPTLDRWVAKGDYTSPPPKALRYESGPIDLGDLSKNAH